MSLCRGSALSSTNSKAQLSPVSPWQQAVAARRDFEAEPPSAHSKATYTRLLDQFRAVYHETPRDLHAPAAVNEVAELLAEQGRQFDDERSLRAAIGEYEFLRIQYPTSSLRQPALLAEAEIAADDLGDKALAEDKLRTLIQEAPQSEPARQARARLAVIAAAPHPSSVRRQAAVAAEPVRATPNADSTPAHAGPLPKVTGIRHWSTATYTRVAIDLGDEVTFEAARVPHPDRIFFDLHGARLAQDLVGKSFDVTDNGFLKRIRAAQQSPDVTRVVLDVSDVSQYSAFLLPNPCRLIIDIHGARPAATPLHAQGPASPADTDDAAPVSSAASTQASAAANRSGLPAMALTGDPAVSATNPSTNRTAPAALPRQTAPAPVVAKSVHLGRPVPNTVAIPAPAAATDLTELSDAPGRVDATSAPTSRPITARVRSHADTATSTTAAPAKAAEKTADGETSLIRALGLKINRIVIDAGHGGHDSGTIGVDGLEEKDVVLDVALRLGKLLHDRLGAEIIYTRSDDTFIPLETRTAIANKAQADLFLSIHANSSPDASARGVEVYYLNFTSDPTALDVAARENAVSGQSIHQLSDLVKKITLKDKIDESREFAADVDTSLFAGLTRGNEGLRNRGTKKAPFVVLIGANMPSILAEISFVTNPRDAGQLRQPEYRERVAESLFSGVARYENGLAGVRPTPAIARVAVARDASTR